jgi:L-lysine 2,3-aminomutase
MKSYSDASTAKSKRKTKQVLYVDRVAQLSSAERIRLEEVTDKYAFRTNDYCLNLINWDDPRDPIRRLVIPHEDELAV